MNEGISRYLLSHLEMITFIMTVIFSFLVWKFASCYFYSPITFAAIFGVFMNGVRIYTQRLSNKSSLLDNLCIHKSFARDKINQIRRELNRNEFEETLSCLIELEIIISDIMKCCDKSKFEDWKKIRVKIAYNKARLNIALLDKIIIIPSSYKIILCINEVETSLNDL